MVGRGSRKDDVPNLTSTNGFAALESLNKPKKKKSDGKSKRLSQNQAKEPEQPVFWPPAPITSKKWADVDDDDDDDYYATTAPLSERWDLTVQQQTKEDDVLEEETESEDDDVGIDDGDDDVEDEVENEPKVPVPAESGLKKPTLAASAIKAAERQLSKKERKKKEDEEFKAVIAELGISNGDNNAGQDGRSNSETEKTDQQNGETEKKDNAPAASDSKISKKKKAKKDKTSSKVKDLQEQPNGGDTNTADEVSGTQPADKDAPVVDVKERIKKVATMRKKKPGKEMDPAAKAAAQEAATRNARAATGKRKDKNHYNQQPIR